MRKGELLKLIRERIASGEWPPGYKLPSSRRLAEELHIRVGVVDGVMATLVAREELITRVGGGRWVPGAPLSEITGDVGRKS